MSSNLGWNFQLRTYITYIALKNLINCKSSEHCDNSTDFKKQAATPFISSLSILTQLKDCMVVLEDISFSCGASKLQILDLIHDKTHMTDLHHKLKVIF